MADVKLKAPDGVESIAFGSKAWRVVEGFITVAGEDVKHLLDHAACMLEADIAKNESAIDAAVERVIVRRARKTAVLADKVVADAAVLAAAEKT